MSSQYRGDQPPESRDGLKEGLPVLNKQFLPGPSDKVERKQLRQNTLPAIHSTPPVIKPGTDHRPRANRSNVDKMPEYVDRRPNPKVSKVSYMRPKEALKWFGAKLTYFERKEIKNFPQIFYLGLDAQKIEAVEGAPQNHGFDDENGVYIKVLNDHIKYRYEILEPIGEGAFGQVLKCLDHKTKEQVALKVLTNNPSLREQVQKELAILEKLRQKDRHNQFNVIHMKEHFVFRGHICITFELQGMNLYDAMRKNQLQGFSQARVRRFSHDILRCLQVLHHEKIIHCDLKPENIVLTKHGNIKVIDFGCSCHENETGFDYIQTRDYRAPEVILRNNYGVEIDMWSLGCIIAELYTGKSLFPGENERDQMARFMEVLGLPPEELIQTAHKRRRFFDTKGNPKPYRNTNGITRKPGSRNLASVLRSSDPVFLDFIKRCLEWDPKKRMTPDEAMAHDWFVEAQKRCRTRIYTRRTNTPPQSATKTQRNALRVQDNTSASTAQHGTGKSIHVRCSPTKDSERLPRLHISSSPKQPTERQANPECRVVRRRPGRRTIIPPSGDAKPSDRDPSHFLPRLS